MNTTSSGREAERRVAKQLAATGYEIIALNWRNRWCEIDIVATRDDTVYFVEVKYRHNEAWGDGFDAVGTAKLVRMRRAAEAWVQREDWPGDAQLLVASVNDRTIHIVEAY